MKNLCIKYLNHISKIIQLAQPGLVSKTKSFKSYMGFQKNNINSSQQQLDRQVEILKTNIQNLLIYCRNLQKQNKRLKNSISFPSQILQRNSYVIGQQPSSIEKTSFSLNNYPYQTREHMYTSLERENDQLKEARSLYLGSLDKIYSLKSDVKGLTYKLSSMYKVYDKQKLDQTDVSQQKDMFLNDTSLIPFSSKQSFEKNSQIDLEYLLCHEELSMDQGCLKENNALKSNAQQNIVQSLIAKGISFREQMAMRSNEFKDLNTIVERYKQQSQYYSKNMNLRKNKSCSYR